MDYGQSFVEWFAEEARRIDGQLIASSMSNQEVLVLREPLGVAALITPWNFPMALVLRKAAAAMAAGKFKQQRWCVERKNYG